jgi:hypothetical protein
VTVTIDWRGTRAARLVEFVFGAVPTAPPEPAAVGLRLEVTGSGRLILSRNGIPVYEDDDAGIVASVLVDEASRSVTAHSRGGLLLHAAALGWRQRGVVVPAPSGAGKTTLAAWLTGAGLDYITDDLAFVPEGTRRLEGLARPLRLRPGSEAALASRPGGWPPPGEVLTAPGARFVSAATLGTRVDGTVETGLVLFATYDPAGDGRATRVSPAQAAIWLMKSLLNAGNVPGHGFGATVDLVRSTEALAIRYRDCRQVEAALWDWARASAAPDPVNG